ncbi:MAG: phosphotransferase family protein [Myxococcota bacterium]
MTEELSQLSTRIASALTRHTGGAVTVRNLKPLHGGACQDNYRVDLTFSSGPLRGERRLALRSDAKQSLPGSINRQREFDVIAAAVQAGVRTPAAHFFELGLVREGAGAYFLDWIDGEAIGRRVVRNPELAQARTSLPDELGAQLARIHSVTPQNTPRPLFGDDVAWRQGAAQASLAALRRMTDALPEVHPAVEVALRWLEDHVPARNEITLVHGDYRTGNFMVTPQGLSGVLDWEFAHWGDPMEDLAWISVRDWRFGVLDQPVGGFSRREPFYAAYEKASGRTVDTRAVRYWEVMGNVRWAVGSVYQGERYLGGQESDLELIAIARRAVEMEHEALRLIRKGA